MPEPVIDPIMTIDLDTFLTERYDFNDDHDDYAFTDRWHDDDEPARTLNAEHLPHTCLLLISITADGTGPFVMMGTDDVAELHEWLGEWLAVNTRRAYADAFLRVGTTPYTERLARELGFTREESQP